ncbi:MAG TPA: asparaginase [Actinomycetota bacterium]|nr:asparaginase [Actinomycetota bacterium]
MSPAPVLVELRRSGLVESVHTGHVVVLDESGSIHAALGDPGELIYPRSTVKPIQALAMLEAGLDVDGSWLALAAASHSGEDFHVRAVRDMLAAAGLPESALRCPPDLPSGDQARASYLAAGEVAAPIVMNCSGKHAAMLWTCSVNGWPLDGYLDPEHPLQRRIHDRLGELAGCEPGPASTDGCGAPLWGLPLSGLAQAFLRLPDSPAGRRVVDAVRAYPQFTGGTTRDVTQLMRAAPGLLAKDGAEGVQAMLLDTPHGRFAVALKVSDGADRARPVIAAAILTSLGVDHPVVREQMSQPVLGGGSPVGSLGPSAALAGLIGG